MIKSLREIFSYLFLSIALSLNPFYAVENSEKKGIDTDDKKIEPKVKNTEPVPVADRVLNLTLDSALQLVLDNNLTLRNAKYDVLMTDTDFMTYLQKYSIRLNADGSYLDQQVPVSGMASSFGGDKATQFDVSVSLSKIFSTGTMLSVGVKENLYDQNDKAIFGLKPTEDPAFHKPSLFLSVQQDLLKNAFGIGDQKNIEILKNVTEMKRDAYIFQLSGLIVSSLVDYWQVVIQENALKNSHMGLDATVQIRDIIGRNAAYGLTDTFELNQYQALVAAAKSRLVLNEFQRDQAMRKLLRTINMPSGTKIQGVTELTEKLPEMDLKKSIEVAFQKRTDYKNALRDIEISDLNLSLANNNALPSMTAFFNISTLGQSDILSTAFADSLTTKYPTWRVGLSISYPLFDSAVKTSLRNAEYKVQQSQIKLAQLRKKWKTR